MPAASSEATEWAGGEVLFCGATDWAMIGRAANKPKKGDPPVCCIAFGSNLKLNNVSCLALCSISAIHG